MTRPASQPKVAHTEDFYSAPSSPAAATLYGILRLYQKAFSTLKWSSCQFSPSCSNYALHALESHGALAAIGMAGDRLIRCNRWAWDSGEYERLRDGHLNDPVTDQLLWADR